MDLYRLEGGGAGDLGLEEYFEGDGVSVVEWPDYLGEAMPESYLLIHFIKDDFDDNKRTLTFEAEGSRAKALLERCPFSKRGTKKIIPHGRLVIAR